VPPAPNGGDRPPEDGPVSPEPPETVSLADAFETIDEQWSPRLAAELNGQAVKLAVVEGAFVEHAHPAADELFYVLSGEITLEFPDRPDTRLREGEVTVVPRGVEHRPVAHEETRLVMFEPAATRNTGDRETAATVEEVDRV
jgi:mannose-6-phosphate isomerase-like protein (cupin superfamily)